MWTGDKSIYTCVKYSHIGAPTTFAGGLANWITVHPSFVSSIYTAALSCAQALKLKCEHPLINPMFLVVSFLYLVSLAHLIDVGVTLAVTF